MSAYISPSRTSTSIHRDPDCYRLEQANEVIEVDPSDYTERASCPQCSTVIETPVGKYTPASVPCPCGEGEATLRRRVTTGTTRNVRGSSLPGGTETTHWHYRHDGCPIGGTVVTDGESVLRRIGPLFDKDAYRRSERAAEAVDRGLVADGGALK